MATSERNLCLDLLERGARQSERVDGDWLSAAEPSSVLRLALVGLAQALKKKLYFHDGAVPAQARFSLIHIDLTDPLLITQCCERYYPRLTAQGLAIVEHYESSLHPQVLQAVHQFFDLKPEMPTTLGTPQAFILK